MVKPTRRKKGKASSGSNSDTSPKQETQRNNLDEKVSFLSKSLMAAQIDQDETSPSYSDMWKVLMRIEDNTNSLINDLRLYNATTMNFERPSNFRKPRLMTFPQAIQFCKLKWKQWKRPTLY